MDGTHTGKLSAESVRGRKAECAVQRSILSPGTAKLRRVQRTKQPKRSRGSGLPFASPLRRAQQKQETATTRGKEFLSRACGQKWVPPKAWRFCDTLTARELGRSRAVLLVFGAAVCYNGSSSPPHHRPQGGKLCIRSPISPTTTTSRSSHSWVRSRSSSTSGTSASPRIPPSPPTTAPK